MPEKLRKPKTALQREDDAGIQRERRRMRAMDPTLPRALVNLYARLNYWADR